MGAPRSEAPRRVPRPKASEPDSKAPNLNASRSEAPIALKCGAPPWARRCPRRRSPRGRAGGPHATYRARQGPRACGGLLHECTASSSRKRRRGRPQPNLHVEVRRASSRSEANWSATGARRRGPRPKRPNPKSQREDGFETPSAASAEGMEKNLGASRSEAPCRAPRPKRSAQLRADGDLAEAPNAEWEEARERIEVRSALPRPEA